MVTVAALDFLEDRSYVVFMRGAALRLYLRCGDLETVYVPGQHATAVPRTGGVIVPIICCSAGWRLELIRLKVGRAPAFQRCSVSARRALSAGVSGVVEVVCGLPFLNCHAGT